MSVPLFIQTAIKTGLKAPLLAFARKQGGLPALAGYPFLSGLFRLAAFTLGAAVRKISANRIGKEHYPALRIAALLRFINAFLIALIAD